MSEPHRVLLVDPPAPDLGLNLGLGYLAACLVKEGHAVQVLDLNNRRRRKRGAQLSDEVARFGPDLVGISSTSPVYGTALDLAREIRAAGYLGLLVNGGVHASLVKGGVLADPEWDAACFGEGEHTVVELARGTPMSEIRGLAWRDGDGRAVENPPRHFIDDLDTLPFPNFAVFGLKRIGWYPIMTSRGCPFECGFCMSPTIWKREWRSRSAASVLAELEHAKKAYRIRGFNVRDDNFSIRMDRAKRMCREFVERGLKLPWTCNNGVYARLIDDELAKLMAEAGCVQVSLGVESLVEPIFDRINKGEDLEDIYRAARMFQDHGIRVRGFMIMGLPGDTYETTMESFRKARELRLDEYGWNTFLPFPHTPGGDWVRKHGRVLTENPWAMQHGDLVFDTPEFPLEDRRRAWNTIVLRTHQYGALYDHSVSAAQNARRVLRMVLKYDRQRLPRHILEMGRRYVRSRERSPG